jgi:CrcB protein
MELNLNRLAADSSYGFHPITRSPVSEPPPFSPSFLLAVALGSAIGGVARYVLTRVVQDRTDVAFPVGTLVVNILGCLLIGVILQAALSSGRMSEATQLLLTTGFCGGFTTFSTFSYESVALMQAGAWPRAIAYVGVSVIAGLGAFWLGTAAVRATMGAPS